MKQSLLINFGGIFMTASGTTMCKGLADSLACNESDKGLETDQSASIHKQSTQTYPISFLP